MSAHEQSVGEADLCAAVAALPEQMATASRDYGRGYAQAVRDVLELLRLTGDRTDGR